MAEGVSMKIETCKRCLGDGYPECRCEPPPPPITDGERATALVATDDGSEVPPLTLNEVLGLKLVTVSEDLARSTGLRHNDIAMMVDPARLIQTARMLEKIGRITGAELLRQVTALKKQAYCAFCRQQFRIDAGEDEVREHIKVCPEHPLAEALDLNRAQNHLIDRMHAQVVALSEASNLFEVGSLENSKVFDVLMAAGKISRGNPAPSLADVVRVLVDDSAELVAARAAMSEIGCEAGSLPNLIRALRGDQ